MNTEPETENSYRKSYQLPSLETPFENIALSISGGGFRAASYGLGVISYLNQVKLNDKAQTPLLKKVTYISSTSGGTITNATYALSTAKGESFEEFYRKLFRNLKATSLLEIVLQKLNDSKDIGWTERPEKSRNLINAFALTYDEELFGYGKLGDLKTGKSHLDEVCFNTTDFYRGLLFRQCVKLKEDDKIDKGFLYGNFIVNLKHKAAEGLKLADLLAASSCFPGGFEPIVFPEDFTYPRLSNEEILENLHVELTELKQEELGLLYNQYDIDHVIKNKSYDPLKLKKILQTLRLRKEFKFGMMDGGTTDNQGIESLIVANERRLRGETKFKPFDFMMINDVASHFMTPYTFPEEEPGKWSLLDLNIKQIGGFALVVTLVSVAGLTYSFELKSSPSEALIYYIVSTFFLIPSVGVLLLFLLVKNKVDSSINNTDGIDLQKNFPQDIVGRLSKSFSSTPLKILIKMLKERFNSVLTLNVDVFLKRIRFLLLNELFEEKHWKFRVKANNIYDLSFSNDTNRLTNVPANPPELLPSREMQIVAQRAFEMPTTLWFDKKQVNEYEQSAVIACGHFTTCYNLLIYIFRLKENAAFTHLSQEYQQRVNDLEIELKGDYEKFKTDPLWLYNQLGLEYKIPDFKVTAASDFKMLKDFEKYRFK